MYTDQEKRQLIEMCKLTRKEDFLRTLNGEDPESILPVFFGVDDAGGSAAYRLCGPWLHDCSRLLPTADGTIDAWGVHFSANEAGAMGAMPTPGFQLLTIDDLPHWRDFVEIPKIPDDINWEMVAKKEIEMSGLDRNESALCSIMGIMPFQELIGMLGFEECFMAFYEEPEAIKEILEEFRVLYTKLSEVAIEYWKPELGYIADDTASKYSPFLSLDMFREFLLPVYDSIMKPYRDNGIPVELHNCGKCEIFMDDFKDIGVKYWEPAQEQNDLIALQKKYKRDFFLCGGLDYVPPVDPTKVTHEEISEMVKAYYERMSENAPFFALVFVLAAWGDPVMMQINGWVQEELFYQGRAYYSRQK